MRSERFIFAVTRRRSEARQTVLHGLEDMPSNQAVELGPVVAIWKKNQTKKIVSHSDPLKVVRLRVQGEALLDDMMGIALSSIEEVRLSP